MSTAGARLVLALLVLVAAAGPALVGCGGPPVSAASTRGGLDGPSDRLAAALVGEVEAYWRREFPTRFGRTWRDLRGFAAVDPGAASSPLACLPRAGSLAGQAVYCRDADVVLWDRARLVPGLLARYGEGAVLVAVAHELGHAVQNRLGIDPADRARYPTALLEGMADCFAGVVAYAAAAGELPRARLAPRERDAALRALLTLRDPVGSVEPGSGHGDGFDRASAFVDGYRQGATKCAAMARGDGLVTQLGFSSLDDLARGGDLRLAELIESVGEDARAWFERLVTARGRRWRVPDVEWPPVGQGSGCPGAPAAGGQGPAWYCPGRASVRVDAGPLAVVHRSLGDYASAELVASRYALAALHALGRPMRGATAGRVVVCLTGGYTRGLLDRGSTALNLSPGDIDEAVDELLDQDLAARDVDGRPPTGDLGFDRVEQFRAGALGGPAACGV